ncbi:hypothetical protein [Flagellimonas sp.]|uniref:hypothetical protein n=1 Tax=Flagellimonas sp. TaxID=2058762 RepID=UPI003BB06E55
MKLVKPVLLALLFLTYSCSSDSASDEATPTNENPDNTSSDDEPEPTTISFCEANDNLKPTIGAYSDQGLSIHLELPENLSLENAEEFGFTITRIYDSEEVKMDISQSATSDFVLTIENLISGFDYEIVGFATIEGSTCFSNPESITATRNYPMSPWSVVPSGIINRYNSYGVTVDGNPYMLLQEGSFFLINEDGSVEQKSNFPKTGNTVSGYTIFDLEGSAYVKSAYHSDLYKYDPTLDTWEKVTDILSNAGYFSGQLDGIGYTFDNSWSFSYTPGDSNFTFVGDEYYTTDLRSKFQTDTDIFIINREYEILQFDKTNGTFSVVANYPGNQIDQNLTNDDIVSFVQDNKAYIGLNLRYRDPGSVNFLDIYEFNLDTFEWKELQPFPVPFKSTSHIGQVDGKNYSYLFFNEGEFGLNGYVWRFDPTQVVYKE